MIIYNVTINIDDQIKTSWLDWMQQEHIPEMLATGKFTKALLSKVLVEEEMGGETYSVQYTAKSRKHLEDYYTHNAEALRGQSKAFEGKFVAFRTELEIISEH
ncbi:MAG: DUF4286 family protein [Gilvibacter sp.]